MEMVLFNKNSAVPFDVTFRTTGVIVVVIIPTVGVVEDATSGWVDVTSVTTSFDEGLVVGRMVCDSRDSGSVDLSVTVTDSEEVPVEVGLIVLDESDASVENGFSVVSAMGNIVVGNTLVGSFVILAISEDVIASATNSGLDTIFFVAIVVGTSTSTRGSSVEVVTELSVEVVTGLSVAVVTGLSSTGAEAIVTAFSLTGSCFLSFNLTSFANFESTSVELLVGEALFEPP